MTGAVVVNKPSGWTSHDVVNKFRRLSQIRKVGHLGTLDPMATGVLPLVVGRATRLAQFYTRADKIYEAELRFGFSTTTYDREGEPTSPITDTELDAQELRQLILRFEGEIEHVPPPVSAKKIGGVPAYKLVRQNIAVEPAPVRVTVYAIELLEVRSSYARLRVECSGGTYLRTIAHDLGKLYGGGAHLTALERLASGEFLLEDSHTIEELAQLAEEKRLETVLIPAARLVPQFPVEQVDDATAGRIREGRDFHLSPFRANTGARYVKAVTNDGDLIAIGEATLPNAYHPLLVL